VKQQHVTLHGTVTRDRGMRTGFPVERDSTVSLSHVCWCWCGLKVFQRLDDFYRLPLQRAEHMRALDWELQARCLSMEAARNGAEVTRYMRGMIREIVRERDNKRDDKRER
jgi:hypothetical protein